MLTISGNNISLTRGDTAEIQLTLTKNGETFTPGDNDIIKFSVANTYKDKSNYALAFQKVIDNTTLMITIEPDDTAGITLSKLYYDIEITYESGAVDTFQSGIFYLTSEVG